MQHFGIIGFPLEHSFSANYFNRKFAEEHIDAEYRLYPLDDIRQFPCLCETHDFTGLNVTLPYKEQVIPYLDELDDTARKIGAVNVIRFRNGRLRGYNTDALGFMESFATADNPPADTSRQALVLGTGGAAKAVHYGLRRLGIEPHYVSRRAGTDYTYADLTQEVVNRHCVVVNCTPLGMYPAVEAYAPFPFEWLTSRHLVYDVIYNPEQTLFLQQATARGARTMNGIGMLYGQARAAWQIWSETDA
ncbi:MAG: shikimate dehydrogenase [Paludibacteraceae bacterium]|nr:shikimate dehydrogenase [Paludibacteraceae bacterium]